MDFLLFFSTGLRRDDRRPVLQKVMNSIVYSTHYKKQGNRNEFERFRNRHPVLKKAMNSIAYSTLYKIYRFRYRWPKLELNFAQFPL